MSGWPPPVVRQKGLSAGVKISFCWYTTLHAMLKRATVSSIHSESDGLIYVPMCNVSALLREQLSSSTMPLQPMFDGRLGDVPCRPPIDQPELCRWRCTTTYLVCAGGIRGWMDPNP